MKRWMILLATLGAVGLAAATGVGVWAGFLATHDASGNVNTAASTSDVLYICQPSGTTTSPICPIDTSGADETIFAANEDLVPGSPRWQKIRVRNTGTEPWDILNMQPTWTELSDPSGLCNIVPEGVGYDGLTYVASSTGPGVTVLGISPGINGISEPAEGVAYDYGSSLNDNHPSVAGSAQFWNLNHNVSYTVHVQPGGYEDLLLGIRLPISTPSGCLNVVWQLTTTWSIQLHVP